MNICGVPDSFRKIAFRLTDGVLLLCHVQKSVSLLSGEPGFPSLYSVAQKVAHQSKSMNWCQAKSSARLLSETSGKAIGSY